MRRSTLTALASVSLAALLSLTSAGYAAQPGIHFDGVLKPQDHWKVGIVNPGNGAFCAMVNKFDQHVGLAFALSPEGFGSVAVDIGQKAFEAGKDYEAVLTTTGGRTEKIAGHATGAQSVVLQIGRNDAFYDSLTRKPGLSVELPAFKAAFALDRFKNGYKELVACAATLSKTAPMPAAPVKDVEKQALAAPLDRALDTISNGGKEDKTALASQADAKTAGAAAIDAQVDADSATVIDNGAKPARKLLASLDDDDSAVPVATDSGAVARNWDAQEAGEVAKQRVAEKTYAAAIKQREQAIAEMKEAVAQQQQAAAQKAAQTAQVAQAVKSAPAPVIAQVAPTKEQTSALQNQVASLQRKLESSQAEQQKLQTAVAALKTKNDKAEDALAARETALTDKEKSLSATAAEVKELASVRADLKTLRASHEATVAKLQRSLSDKDAQYATLQAQVGKLNAEQANATALKTKLAAAQKEISGIRKSLVIVNDPPDAGATQAKAQLEKAQAEIATLRDKNAKLSESLASVTQEAVQKQETAKAQAGKTAAAQADDGAALKTARAEIENLRAKNAQLSSSLAGVTLNAGAIKTAKAEPSPVKEATAQKTDNTADAQQKIALMGAQAEIMKLKTEKLALLQKLDLQQQVTASVARAPSADDIHWTSHPAQSAQGYTHVSTKTVRGTVAHAAVENAAVENALPAQAQPTLAEARAVAQVQPAAGGDGTASTGFDNANGSFNANKAEAFLDRIMSYHHVPGRDAPVNTVKTRDVNTQPEHQKPVRVLDTQSDYAPAPQLAPAVGSLKEPVRDSVVVQPAAPQAQPVAARTVVASIPSAQRAPVAAPLTPVAPVETTVSQADPISLDSLLRQAGLSTVRYVPASESSATTGQVRQWTTGKLNGMVEQMPAGNFDTLVQSYVERYRQDCGGQLKVDMGTAQTLGANSKLQQASVTCPMSNNSYDTSFVFLQNAKTFSAVLHTGYPSDAARINAIGDNIAYALKSAGGLVVSGDAAEQTAQNAPLLLQATSEGDYPAPVTQDHAPLRLNMQPASSAGYGAPAHADDALQTVVVQ